MSVTAPADFCRVCRHPGINEIVGYRSYRRIASDGRSLPHGGRLGVCPNCQAVQKLADADWLADTRDLAGRSAWSGAMSIDPETGRMIDDAGAWLERWRPRLALPAQGRLLEVGCGRGELLRRFGEVFSGWELCGVEQDERFRAEVLAIPGVGGYFTSEEPDVPGQFDLITMVHLLERLLQPTAVLSEARGKLSPTGWVVTTVRDYRRDPFALLVADEVLHFTPPVLAGLFAAAGFGSIDTLEDGEAGEISVIAQRGRTATDEAVAPARAGDAGVKAALHWLAELCRLARHRGINRPLGIFGASVGGAWLAQELGDRVRSSWTRIRPRLAGGCSAVPSTGLRISPWATR